MESTLEWAELEDIILQQVLGSLMHLPWPEAIHSTWVTGQKFSVWTLPSLSSWEKMWYRSSGCEPDLLTGKREVTRLPYTCLSYHFTQWPLSQVCRNCFPFQRQETA